MVDINFMSKLTIFIDTCSTYWQPEVCTESLMGKYYQCAELEMTFSCDHLSGHLVGLVCDGKKNINFQM